MALFRRKDAGGNVELKVTGMHCEHCEMTVRRALTAVPGVRDAKADRKGERATVAVEGEVDMDALVSAVEEAGYRAEAP